MSQRSGYDEACEDHHEEPRLGAGRRTSSRLPGPDDSQYRMDPSRLPLAAVVLMMMSRISARERRDAQLRPLRREQKAIEVRFEVVDLAVDQARSVEDPVAAMHHVIVERQHHQGRVGDDAAQLAGIE